MNQDLNSRQKKDLEDAHKKYMDALDCYMKGLMNPVKASSPRYSKQLPAVTNKEVYEKLEENKRPRQKQILRNVSNNISRFTFTEISKDDTKYDSSVNSSLGVLSPDGFEGGEERIFIGPSSHMKRKLSSEQNSTFQNTFHSHKSKSGGEQSLAENPFDDYSKLSVASDAFSSDADVSERLRADEKAWRKDMLLENNHSLSEAFGDMYRRAEPNDLCMTTYLRSGSGPLGSLDGAGCDVQRPDFGHPVFSPERKHKPYAILPPPKENATFSLDKTLANITRTVEVCKTESQGQDNNDITVPSLSYIGSVLEQAELSADEMLEKLRAYKRKQNTNKDQLYKTELPMHESFSSNYREKKQSNDVFSEAAAYKGKQNSNKVQLHKTELPMFEESFSSNYRVKKQSNDVLSEAADLDKENERACVFTPQAVDPEAIARILSEPPKISLLSPSNVEMVHRVSGESTDLYKNLTNIKLENNGSFAVPLTLTLYQEKFNNINVFYFNEKGFATTVTYLLRPGETYSQMVFCRTPPIFNPSRDKESPGLKAKVDISLITLAQIRVPLVRPVSLHAVFNYNFFSAPSHLIIPVGGFAPFKLFNAGSVPVAFQTTSISKGFAIEPQSVTVHPQQTVHINVFTNGKTSGNLELFAKEVNTSHKIRISGYSSFSRFNLPFVGASC